MNAVIISPLRAEQLPALPVADLDRAANFAKQDKAESTRQAYRSDFSIFRAWCLSRGVSALPAKPETVAGFLAAQAESGLGASTITRRSASIRYAHKVGNFEPPTNSEAVKATLRGIRRAIGAAPGRKAPAVAEVMRDMARIAPLNLKGLRDRALLLMGFSGAFRRSELVALDVADLEETSEGLRVTIRRSKTDQEGVGATIAIIRGGACCPVRALKEWLDAARIESGPVFRPVAKGNRIRESRLTGKSVCDITKAYAHPVGPPAPPFLAPPLHPASLPPPPPPRPAPFT